MPRLVSGDFLNGFGGNDTINRVTAGTGLVFGGGGDNIQANNSHSQVLDGNGNDTLIGTNDRDLLVGGTGADQFTLRQYCGTGLTDTTRDQILAFNRRRATRWACPPSKPWS